MEELIMRKFFTLMAVYFLMTLMFGPALAGSGRDYVSIVGSSTVYPFATVVAEQFGKSTCINQDRINIKILLFGQVFHAI